MGHHLRRLSRSSHLYQPTLQLVSQSLWNKTTHAHHSLSFSWSGFEYKGVSVLLKKATKAPKLTVF
jgi:hypothetical protein